MNSGARRWNPGPASGALARLGAPAEGHGAERRASPRTSYVNPEELASARLVPGRSVRVINLSSGGALIEADCRLLPGAQVELQLAGPSTLQRVRGRILRSHVAVLDREQGIRYRGALVFDEELAPGGDAAHRGG